MEMAGREYNEEFDKTESGGSRRSAEIVLKLVFKEFGNMRSVIDVGCGVGAWLAVCRELGCTSTVGIDRHIEDAAKLCIGSSDFIRANLEERIKIEKRFDLCVSLGVAEHLSRSRAATFVEDLCTLSDIVLFSAAVPGEGGVNHTGQSHINQQWHSFWVRLFERNGYACFDLIRKRVWHDSRVDWRFAQNIYVFADKRNERLQKTANLAAISRDAQPFYDAVHPMLLASYASKCRHLETDIQELKRKLEETWATYEGKCRDFETYIQELKRQIETLLQSKSWRYTRFLRLIGALARRVGAAAHLRK
jgi:SAM-dependent methyltransferase